MHHLYAGPDFSHDPHAIFSICIQVVGMVVAWMVKTRGTWSIKRRSLSTHGSPRRSHPRRVYAIALRGRQNVLKMLQLDRVRANLGETREVNPLETHPDRFQPPKNSGRCDGIFHIGRSFCLS